MPKKPSTIFRLIHCSDIHFCVFPKNPFQCFNKRFKGLLRQLIGGVSFRALAISQRFPQLIEQLEADGVCVTGDVTITALDSEFRLAKEFLSRIETIAPVYIVPGNHDVYTYRSLKKQTFYSYFPNKELQTHRIAFQRLTSTWWLVLLDCSCFNGWYAANGEVTSSQLRDLESFLSSLPPSDHVIVANHYPLSPTTRPAHDLLNYAPLKSLLMHFPSVRLYIHGHDHHVELNHLPPLVVNSGSLTLPSNARFHIIDLHPEGGYQISTAAITNLTETASPLKISIEETTISL
ncbi:metallophosphoesterase family protein [Chlamydia suis]|uniref:metallophosphoesterase family protein n=1 Tax=Chlamydia suis TaxID=83559 RepID=UPI0009B0480D|nr:metallophosphoesterase [Chlamydia suis]